MRGFIASVAILSGLAPSMVTLGTAPSAVPSWFAGAAAVCGLALLASNLALVAGGDDPKVKAEKESLLDQRNQQISQLQAQVNQKQRALEENEVRVKKAEEFAKMETGKLDRLTTELAKALISIEKVESQSNGVADALLEVKDNHQILLQEIEKLRKMDFREVAENISKVQSLQSQNKQHLLSVIEKMANSFEVLRSQTNELGQLNEKLSELRSQSGNPELTQSVEIAALNLSLRGSREPDGCEAANNLQLLNQRLRNRDDLLRTLSANIEQQTTQLALRAEASLRSIQERLQEVQLLQVSSASFAEGLGDISRSLELCQTKLSNEVVPLPESPVIATQELKSSVAQLVELGKVWKMMKKGG